MTGGRIDGDGEADELFDPEVAEVGRAAGGGTKASVDNGFPKLNESLISALVLESGFTSSRDVERSSQSA